jgi:phosphopantetheinyl transferase
VPIGVEKIELYGPTPPVGTRVGMTGEMTEFDAELRRIKANVDVDDGAGNVWMRIVGWTDFVFDKPPEIAEFQKLPAETFVAREIVLPDPPRGTVCTIARIQKSRYMERLAALLLHIDEESEYFAIEDPRRRRDFLASRFAVKDAVRLWWMRRGAGPIHPATIRIDHDERGRPFVSEDGEPVLPWISLAHTDGTAVAVASDAEAGVDLEPLANRNAELNGYASDREKSLLASIARTPDDAWDLRLWCAKEAAAKALGTGLQGRPRDFALAAGNADGLLEIRHAATGERFPVQSFPFEGHLVAFARRHPEGSEPRA